MGKNRAELREWFNEQVDELKDDPEYISYGLMVDLAGQIAKKLKKEGLKQKDLAARLGKTEGWISRFMNDPTNFSVKKLVEIATALDMELEISFRDRMHQSNSSTKESFNGPNQISFVAEDSKED